MKQYAGFRKSQAEDIKIKQEKLNKAIVTLQSKKEEKEKIIAQTAKEKEELEKQKQEKEKLVKIIQKDKKKYSAEIDKKEKERKEVDRQIKKTIADAIAAANRKAAEKAKADAKKNNTSTKTNTTVTKAAPSSTSNSKFILTAEGKVDSDNFKANKGKLPLPVEKGYISLPYGDQPHPIHKNLTTHNSGVEITTEAGSYARAVFGGEVIQIQAVYANNYAVYIRHGDYISIYMNISSLNVSVGDNVSIKQKLGKIHTNSEGKTIMKFIITQNSTYMNPSSWLSL